jgi:hypothetical protein
VQPTEFCPPFAEQLFFIFLKQKQNSREGIRRYRALPQVTHIEQVSELTHRMLHADSLADFEEAMRQHEQLVAATLQLPPVQQTHFADYPHGVIKSLGAWGGDFVLATSSASPTDTRAYFVERGYDTFFSFFDMLYYKK